MYTYGGFSRGINLNFQVPVLSSQEQTPTLNKINALKSAVLPQYRNDLPVATFCKLKIGDLIADDTTYVVLNSVNHSLDTDVPWSVGSDEKLLPQLYKLSISMKVLHKNIPQVWNPTVGRQFIGHNV
jgi:DNA-directed RNA polymerase subunit H (RpoH/RPB5)